MACVHLRVARLKCPPSETFFFSDEYVCGVFELTTSVIIFLPGDRKRLDRSFYCHFYASHKNEIMFHSLSVQCTVKTMK